MLSLSGSLKRIPVEPLFFNWLVLMQVNGKSRYLRAIIRVSSMLCIWSAIRRWKFSVAPCPMVFWSCISSENWLALHRFCPSRHSLIVGSINTASCRCWFCLILKPSGTLLSTIFLFWKTHGQLEAMCIKFWTSRATGIQTLTRSRVSHEKPDHSEFTPYDDDFQVALQQRPRQTWRFERAKAQALAFAYDLSRLVQVSKESKHPCWAGNHVPCLLHKNWSYNMMRLLRPLLLHPE